MILPPRQNVEVWLIGLFSLRLYAFAVSAAMDCQLRREPGGTICDQEARQEGGEYLDT